MPRITKPIFRCECIDQESLSDLKIAMITARDTYEDIVEKLKGTGPEFEKSIESIEDNAKRFHMLTNEIKKIKPCVS